MKRILFMLSILFFISCVSFVNAATYLGGSCDYTLSPGSSSCSSCGAVRCSGKIAQECNKYTYPGSGVSYYWVNLATCSGGCMLSGSNVICSTSSTAVIPASSTPASSCTNDCLSGTKSCFTTSYKVCGEYDGDGCVEWGPEIPCPTGQTCTGTGYGVTFITTAPSCTPNCAGKNCGSDNCGGSCGTCSSDQTCTNGNCVATATTPISTSLPLDPILSTENANTVQYKSCRDSDGNDRFVLGTVTAVNFVGYVASFTDYCLGAGTNKLREFSCSSWRISGVTSYKSAISTIYDCTYGCSNGVCLKAPAAPATCTDTDEGKVYYTKGFISGIDASDGDTITNQPDVCGGTILNEYYCGNNSLVYVSPYNCPNGCENGACVEIPAGTIVCDSTISSSTTLNNNMNCQGKAITIGADNIILDCQGHNIIGKGYQYGISLTGRKNITIKNCNIDNFEYGIDLSGTDNSKFIHNKIINNDWGIFLSTSYNNLFYDNYLEANTKQAKEASYWTYYGAVKPSLKIYNYWNTSKDCTQTNIVGGDCIGGNYWSTYTGQDTNGNGIGDTLLPYQLGYTSAFATEGYFLIPDISGDNLPLVLPLACTPTETTELTCDDNIDNDCDNLIDSADSDCIAICTEGEKRCSGNILETCTDDAWVTDTDCSTLTGQCKESTEKYTGTCWDQYKTCGTEPIVPENICNDNIDNDCDNLMDAEDNDCITKCADLSSTKSYTDTCALVSGAIITSVDNCDSLSCYLNEQYCMNSINDVNCPSSVCLTTTIPCLNGCVGGSCRCTTTGECPLGFICQNNLCVHAKQCSITEDCDDINSCTIDACESNSCSNAPITECKNNDGCCPSGCDYENDKDCTPFCTDNFYTLTTSEENKVCIQPGVRLYEEKYCNRTILITNQKEESISCSSNYECKSNICSPDNKCITYSSMKQAYCQIVAQLGQTSEKCQ